MRGIWTALITPFQEDGSVDLGAFQKFLKAQKDAGVAGVIPCGTTGEAPTLKKDEKKLLIQTAIEALKGSKTQVIAGTGTNNTAETVEMSKWASDQGVAGVLVVTPYYNKPSPAGLEAHFRAVADAVTCEVMLYNVPGRSAIGMAPDLIARLAAHPRIRSIKEATGRTEVTSEILDQLRVAGRAMDVLSGDDATFLPLLAAGATGVVSVASNLVPHEMAQIQALHEAGRVREAFALHQRLYPLFRDLFIESNPGPIKVAMARAGIGRETMRAPMAPMTAPSRERLLQTLSGCGITEGSLR